MVYILSGKGFAANIFEEGSFLNVGGLLIPLKIFTLRGGELFPFVAAVEDNIVHLFEVGGTHTAVDGRRNFFLCGPDIAQIDRIAVRIVTQWLVEQVYVYPPCECV